MMGIWSKLFGEKGAGTNQQPAQQETSTDSGLTDQVARLMAIYALSLKGFFDQFPQTESAFKKILALKLPLFGAAFPTCDPPPKYSSNVFPEYSSNVFCPSNGSQLEALAKHIQDLNLLSVHPIKSSLGVDVLRVPDNAELESLLKEVISPMIGCAQTFFDQSDKSYRRDPIIGMEPSLIRSVLEITELAHLQLLADKSFKEAYPDAQDRTDIRRELCIPNGMSSFQTNPAGTGFILSKGAAGYTLKEKLEALYPKCNPTEGVMGGHPVYVIDNTRLQERLRLLAEGLPGIIDTAKPLLTGLAARQFRESQAAVRKQQGAAPT